MKAKIGLFLFTMLAWTGMGFAAPGFPVTETPKSYYNLTTVYTQQGFNRITTLVLSQGATPCSSSEWSLSYKGANYVANGSGDIGSYSGGGFFGMGQQFTTKGKCLAAFDDTPANLAEKLETLWVKNAELHKVALELGSDIDLKEFAANTKVGECSVNHVPLPMMDSTSFNGNGFTISHMCYAATVTKDSPMEAPVGFFKTASDVSMQNIKLNGVRIYITGESENGADYYPVGALVGAVNSMSIDTVLLANDSIQAPLAGGVVGYLENATVSNVTGDDDINISNTTTITTGYAGSKIISKVLYQELDHKVFLGGIAGVAIRSEHAEDATFLKDSIKVDVHNRAKGFRSALGGIAGYFKTVGGTQEKLQVYTKYKDQGEIVPTKISGGSSMGGIFGVVSVNRETSGMVTSSGNLTVSNSKFDGKITNASSPAVIAVGGIVGYDSTGNMSSLSLVQNYSKIDVKDDLKDAGNYQYYAGGIVGYGGSCLGGTGQDEEFFSVMGSKAEGAISLSASAATVSGLRSDAYLGGIAGSACLARTKGNGLTNDTSLVAITSKVKTAVDNQKLYNGANARDNVFVGGIAGSVAVAVSNKADTLSGLYYNGSIVVEDSLNNVYAGGILGGFPRSAGGKWIYLEKSIARSEGTLVSYSVKEAGAATTSNKQQVAIGGACGSCDEITGLNFVGITGNINVSAKNTGDAMYVGGLVGYADVPNAAGVKTVVQNTYGIGNILVNASNTANAQYVKNVGYLMGRAVLGGAYEIISSYHYGEDKDDMQIDAFGSLSNGVDITTNWVENENIYYVIRNGAAQSLHGGAKHQNGTEIAATMKTAKFAGFLNEAYTENKDYAWAFAKGTNNDLPIFAINGYSPALPDVEYVVTFVGMNNDLIKTVPVPEHGSATPPTTAEMEDYQVEGYTFTGNWDSRGKDYEDVTDDITVYAVYSVNVYDVKFFNYDSTLQIGETQEVEYMKSAVAPDAPVREGYTFEGWSVSYTQVKDNLNIKALYTANEYLIEFKDYNGDSIYTYSALYDDAVAVPVNVTRAATKEYTYEFKGWTPEVTKVKGDAVYTATYDSTKIKYAVTFVDYDNTRIGDVQMVEYGDSAVAPADPTREGYKFVGWDRDFDSVTKALEVKAQYEQLKFQIVFKDYDGEELKTVSLAYGATVVTPKDVKRASTAEYMYTFKEWTPALAVVTADAAYTAVYDSTMVLYKVSFLDYDESLIGDVQLVPYDSAAVAPAEPVREGYTFAGWDRKFDKITKDVDVKATYEKNPESSSSVEVSSSSEPESSSSVEESSSSVEPESSSSVEISSSSEPESSSSVPEVSSSSITGEIKIVQPTIEQSGNAIRLTFGTENVDETAVAHIVVTGENGVILETDIPNSVVGGGEWEMTPAPIGKFKVTLTVGDKVRHAEYNGRFEVTSQITAAPGSWQMVSLSAFDKKKVLSDDAAFYWWDEKNPVGDYWQYRAFNGESVEATRGFWYGTTVGNPLVIRESTGSKDSEIVWELDSLFSGWNLVANPYGWYVDLTKGVADNDAKVTFWRWNPSTGSYDPMPKVIGPYEAVWAKVSKSTTWRMSAAPEFKIEERSAAETKKVMHKDAAGIKGAWSLKVSLADGYGKQDSWNVIGAGAEESLEEPPAGMGNHVSLAIRNSEKGAKLAKSIKAVANEYSWILDVSANSARDGKLKFEGIKELNGKGLKLFVTAEGVTTEITNEKSLNVALAKSAKQVEVRVAASDAVIASSKISGFGSTLAGGTLQLGFTAPEALAGARASYAVVGVDGKKVAAGQFKATAGTNQFSLNAPKSGVYFVKIKVGSQLLSGKVLVK